MNGRMENEIKINNYIDKKLNNKPEIIRKYSNSLSGKTLQTKKVYINYIIDFFDYINSEEEIYNIKKSDIDVYINKMVEEGKGCSIINGRIAGISSFYEFLVDDDIIKSNPCSRVKKIKDLDEKEIVYMTFDEIKLVKENILKGKPSWKYRDLAIFELGCTTGLRVSAIQEINLQDVDLKNNTIKVIEKGRKVRNIKIGENTKFAIHRWMMYREKILKGKDIDALFISNRLKRMSVDAIEEMIEKHTSILGKHITPHKMRSSCATNLYEKTGDIYLVQDVLGHKNISNTRRYAKVSDNKRKEAVSILDNML